MNFSLFTGLYDEVLPDLPGVPQLLALNAIRSASIEFCERSCCWVVDADPISAVANQPVYQFEPEAGTDVVCVVQAWYNGQEIHQRTADQLEDELSIRSTAFIAGSPWNEQPGVPLFFMIERPDEFVLAPFPSTALANAIKMKVAVKPSRTAKGMERWILNKYFEALASGAKYRLLSMQKKPWSSPELAMYHKREFDLAINGATAHTSHTLPTMNTATSPI